MEHACRQLVKELADAKELELYTVEGVSVPELCDPEDALVRCGGGSGQEAEPCLGPAANAFPP